MKNVTISIDDETYKAARIYAAASGTSVSALVKQYLADLTNASEVDFKGFREMPLGYSAQPQLPPLDAPLSQGAFGKTPEGKPYFTRDGKPRKPGAMRHLLGEGWTEDFDSWPDGFIDAIYGDGTEAADNWWKPFAKPPTKSGK
jgi:hypothetical protein